MTPSFRILALSAAACLAFSAAPVLAQAPQGGQPSQDLSQILHLRPDQMASLHAFQSGARPTPDEINRLRGASSQVLAGLTTPQRLQRIGVSLETQEAMFRRSADATRAFYSQLSPDQQRTFDQITAPRPQGGMRPQP